MLASILWIISHLVGAILGWGYLLKTPRHLAEVRKLKKHWEEAKREKPAFVESAKFAYRNTRMANYCGIVLFGVVTLYCTASLAGSLIP